MSKLEGRSNLLEALSSYQPWDETEAMHVQNMISFISREPQCFDRAVVEGHITGSAWIVSPDERSCILVHHKKLNRWLQPGGHADGNTDVFEVAQQEALEETGLKKLQSDENIFDIDVHLIPARKSDPEHYHYDIRFKFTGNPAESILISSESNAVEWVPLNSLEKLIGDEPSIIRMARKVRSSARSEKQ